MQNEPKSTSNNQGKGLITLTQIQSDALRNFFSVQGSDGYRKTFLELFEVTLQYDVDDENPKLNAADTLEKFFNVRQAITLFDVLEPASNS